MTKEKVRAQVKSRFYYVFCSGFHGTATVAVVLGQLYVGTGYRLLHSGMQELLNKVDGVLLHVEEPNRIFPLIMNVKVIRMWSGEDVVADLVKEGDETITVCNPIVAVPTRDGQMGFAPWAPLLSGKNVDLDIARKYVVYISDTQDEIVENYTQMFSTIQTPSKKLIV